MRWTSVVAIYCLFWAFSLFLVLPFRLKSGREDKVIPGQAAGAPQSFSLLRTAKWTTIVAAALFGLFYGNYLNGWVTPEQLDLVPPEVTQGR